MKNKIIVVIIFLAIANLLFSIAISFSGAVNRNYFNDFRNFKSLKNPKGLMKLDTLILETFENRYFHDQSFPTLIIKGYLQSNNSKLKMNVGKPEYFNYNLDKHAVYRNELTNYSFLKDAPNGYHKKEYRSFLMKMYFKISLIPLLVFLMFLIKKYRDEKI